MLPFRDRPEDIAVPAYANALSVGLVIVDRPAVVVETHNDRK